MGHRRSQSVTETCNDAGKCNRAWQVQIYVMSGATAQELVVRLLSGAHSLPMESTDDGLRHFLIVESSGDSQARSVHKAVVSTDAGAVLLHTAYGLESPRALTAV